VTRSAGVRSFTRLMGTPMDEASAQAALSSRLPSDRARGVAWFLEFGNASHTQLLVRAIESETVPSIRKLLSRAVAGTQEEPQGRSAPLDRDELLDPAGILDDVAGLIKHETEPVIGWIRRSVARELGPQYEMSDTFRNIELLRLRLSGLESLVSAHRIPTWTALSLEAILRECWPSDMSDEALARPTGSGDDDIIESDRGLLAIIVSNALQNAHEAVSTLEDGAVWVETGVTDQHFWLSVTNRFDGQTFNLEHVIATGTSTKARHKGLGLNAMKLASERLGYDLSLTASGGTAFFRLRGERFHG
jgi:hypothetical protein